MNKTNKAKCLFCMRSHKVKPKLCKAKADIFRAYLKSGAETWQVMCCVQNGTIALESEAIRLVKARDKHGQNVV